LQRSLALAAASAGGISVSGLIAGCSDSGQPTPDNRFVQTNLVASNPMFQPLILDTTLVNAWGIAIRPAGAGGHFWVTASSASYEYVGDVNGTPLFQDSLKLVTLPLSRDVPVSQDPVGAANGVVFNSGPNFVITQDHPNGPITSFARFIFVSDNGVLSAWTERPTGNGNFDRPDVALTLQDYSKDGSSFFGLAISPAQDKLFVVDFGANPAPDGAANPKIRVFDSVFTEEPLNGRFANPFVGPEGFKVGDLVPFNIQTVTYDGITSVFITYVNTSVDENGQLVVAVEDSGRGRGRLVEYTPDGGMLAIWDDQGTLNGPWGVVVAPMNFGAMSNQLIVGNFSDGTIVGFDTRTRRATEFMRDRSGNVIKIQGLWALLFGNGASLGDTNALYFAAGPADETEGLFGSLRVA
jgi:uncharacterized protein (TIGR03118 family)